MPTRSGVSRSSTPPRRSGRDGRFSTWPRRDASRATAPLPNTPRRSGRPARARCREMALLLLNAGSSGLKFSLLDPGSDETVARGEADFDSSPVRYAFERKGTGERTESVSWKGFEPAVERILGDLSKGPRAEAVVHRIVHGGTRFIEPVLLTPGIREALTGLADLAPLHLPPSLEVLDAAHRLLPDVPQVLVFDTAFHATLSPEAYTYPLPREWSERWGLRKFGFHGLSPAWSSGRAAELLARPPKSLRLIVAHLGSGASVTAVEGGRSVETTMGFTPLEGLMMGSRSGSVDPGLLLHLERRCGIAAPELEQALYHASGLLGVSGVSSDFRKVLEARRAGDPAARLAFRIFARRTRQAVGAMAATLGGVDALVFTGGIGEHSPELREEACEGLECLGLDLDDRANAAARPDVRISREGSPATILVVAAREDLMMARAASAVLTAE